MVNLNAKLATGLVLLLSTCSGTLPLSGSNETHAATALFKSFETLFRTSPRLLSRPDDAAGSLLATDPFDYLLAGLDALGPNSHAEVLNQSIAVMVGTKDYHPPLGLGRVRSARCYVLVLREESGLKFSEHFKKAEAARAVGRAPVWHWLAQLGEFGEQDARESSLFAAQIDQSHFVLSNDLETLLAVSEQLVSQNRDAPTLTGIRDWNQINKYEVWAYRRYRHETTSAFERISGTAGVTSDAEGLAVYLDGRKGNGVLRLYSRSSHDPTAQNVSSMYSIPPLKSVGPGIWEMTFRLSETPSEADTERGILWLFGSGVLV